MYSLGAMDASPRYVASSTSLSIYKGVRGSNGRCERMLGVRSTPTSSTSLLICKTDEGNGGRLSTCGYVQCWALQHGRTACNNDKLTNCITLGHLTAPPNLQINCSSRGHSPACPPLPGC